MSMKDFKIWKFNLFDIVIIALIIIFGIILCFTKIYRGSESINETDSKNSFSYVISVECLSKTSEDMLKIGDEVFDKVSNTKIGKITDIEVKTALSTLELSDGSIILSEIPEKIDVNLTIETEGIRKNSEFLANGLIRILVGNTKQIKTKYLMCQGVITSIENGNI